MPISHLLPLFSAIWVFGLGLFVLTQVILGRNRSLAHVLFSFFCFGTTFWLLGTFMMFRSTNDEAAIFWDRFLYVAAILNPILLYHFGRAFLDVKKKKWVLWLGYALALFFLIISRTDYFVSDLYKYSWGVHTKARLFHHVFLVYFICYVNLFLITVINGLKTTVDKLKRTQLKYIFAALMIMAIVGVPAFLPAYGIDIFPFSYLSGAIFAIITAYAITQHGFLSQVMATDILVVLILGYLFIPIMVPEFQIGIFGKLSFLILITFFGFLLTKSVRQEIFYSEEMKKAYDSLKKLDKAKSEFVSIASHQLRTPLTAIKGYISMILEGGYGRLASKTEQPLKKIYQANERLIKLVNDLLNLSRIESGRIELLKEKISIEVLINNAIDILKLGVENKKLYLKFKKPEKPLPELIVDKEKIGQAIINIVDNAIRYTESGGITIKVSEEKEKETNDKIIIIEVKDTGLGMEKKDIKDLFESFSRGQAGTKHWTEGAGLGLYIAKKFVEMHGGRIWAESPGPDKGSTFSIELPINS